MALSGHRSPGPPPGSPPGRRPAFGLAYWPGWVFGGIGLAMFATGLYLTTERILIALTWPAVEARVVESRIETKGSQHAAQIRVAFEVRGSAYTTEPASDYRSSRYHWIAATVDRLPVDSLADVRYDPRDPLRTRLEVGANFNTFGVPLLLLAVGLCFGGVGVLAHRSARLEARGKNARTQVETIRLARAQYLGVAGFIGVLGLSFGLAGSILLPPALAMRQWPVIPGRVEKTDVFTRTSRERKQEPVTFYVGRVYLSYPVDGRTYRSAVVLRASSTQREKVENELAQIRAAGTRPVRVNPADPYDAADLSAWPLVLPVVFLFAGAVVLALAVLIVRSAPKTPRSAPES